MDVIDAAAIRGGESGNSCGGGGCMGGCRSYVSLSWIEEMGGGGVLHGWFCQFSFWLLRTSRIDVYACIYVCRQRHTQQVRLEQILRRQESEKNSNSVAVLLCRLYRTSTSRPSLRRLIDIDASRLNANSLSPAAFWQNPSALPIRDMSGSSSDTRSLSGSGIWREAG
jgi:hypothetical protein